MSKKIIIGMVFALAIIVTATAFFIVTRNNNSTNLAASVTNSNPNSNLLNANLTNYAAKVIVAKGILTAQNFEQPIRHLDRNSLVYQNDTVSSGDNSEGELHFTDGSLLAIQPDSKITIARYDYSQSPVVPGEIRYAVNLVQGGLTSVSGQIAHLNPTTYQLSAGVATIGVHGTTFSGQIINSNDNLSGTSVWHISTGAISITSKNSKPVLLDASNPASSQFATVSKSGQIARYVKLPAFIANKLPPAYHFVSAMPVFAKPAVVTKPVNTTAPKNLVNKTTKPAVKTIVKKTTTPTKPAPKPIAKKAKTPIKPTTQAIAKKAKVPTKPAAQTIAKKTKKPTKPVIVNKTTSPQNKKALNAVQTKNSKGKAKNAPVKTNQPKTAKKVSTATKHSTTSANKKKDSAAAAQSAATNANNIKRNIKKTSHIASSEENNA